MKGNKRHHTPEFKSRLALEALRERYSAAEIASNFDVHVSLIHAWRQMLKKCMVALFRDGEKAVAAAPDMRSLDQRIEELKAEQEWMRQTAARFLDLHERRDLVDPEDGEMSVLRQTSLLGLHRSGVYYQKSKENAGVAEDGEE